MSPVWHAARTGMRRGRTELRQTFTSGQDVFGYVLWTVLLMVPLFLAGDERLEGAGISAGAFMLPSMLGMTLAFTGVMTTAQLLAAEREDGTLLRAKAVPHGMVGHLVGKIVMVSGTALVSMALPFVVGVFLVDGVARQGGGALLTLVWVVPLGLLATLPLGAVIGSLVDNPRTIGLLMLPVMGLVVISGIYFPLSELPGWVQTVGQVFPVYWLGLGLRAALLPAGAVAAEVDASWRYLETVGVLGAWAVAGLLLAPSVLRRMARRESGATMAERRRKAMQRVG
ncbi:ABC transporter permease [Streptomyces griseomycini]|uniref:ABC-2 type transport system permease protein n=1 Tax=Streptomyces griseomycini TaxID=66895 RepID=A0A7W7PUV9_9ACTN|nr:ABC transporter permease [Streptomyces griseomycini]MBB4901717.1 ABC-2 type transport system permease protein [Streptomyces griseomycini]GGQ30806.1 transport permease protein [Streptomyces griseomycini]GGR50118.1 transport permease protein [Streptomyces griseomycini]